MESSIASKLIVEIRKFLQTNVGTICMAMPCTAGMFAMLSGIKFVA